MPPFDVPTIVVGTPVPQPPRPPCNPETDEECPPPPPPPPPTDVPEPATWLILLAAILGAGWMFRRKDVGAE